MASPLLLAQQVFSALNSHGGALKDVCANATTSAVNGTLPNTPLTPTSFPTDLPSLIGTLISFSALRDWFKIFVIGSLIETLRRLALHSYRRVYNSFFITARFEEDDASYNWMMFWLSQQPAYKFARDVQVSTESFGLNSCAVMIEGEGEDPNSLNNNDGSRQLAYLPSVDTVHSMWYKGRWTRVSRTSREGFYGRREYCLEVCILSTSHTVLNQFLIDAKKAYTAAQQHSISVYISDISNNWRLVATRPKRPLTSIVLDPGIKDLLVEDARDFLSSKRWYSARGIPFRRGYLLYGAPGSGKTSIIHSLAGELGLDVYVISLSRMGLDDTSLSELISDLPQKCIALMEDIDAAFSQTLNREPDEDSKDGGSQKKEDKKNQAPAPTTSRITLSGLLNALDGVAAQEGRILFATTNKYSSLDPALCRPGRMDLHIEFKLASKYQASELYKRFYLPDEDEEDAKKSSSAKKEEEKKADGSSDSGYSSSDEKASGSASSSRSSSPQREAVTFSGTTHHRVPKLAEKQVLKLAKEFSDIIPEREFSMATLQGYLMGYKVRPFDAVTDAQAWVEKERKERKVKQDKKSEEKKEEVLVEQKADS